MFTTGYANLEVNWPTKNFRPAAEESNSQDAKESKGLNESKEAGDVGRINWIDCLSHDLNSLYIFIYESLLKQIGSIQELTVV